MTTKLTRLTHTIAMQLHIVAESCTICSSRSRWPVRKLLDTPSYFKQRITNYIKEMTASGMTFTPESPSTCNAIYKLQTHFLMGASNNI
jgi:hypothetical protein